MAKPIRLNKAAAELNIAVNTIVDFLGTKGIVIDNNPNTKIEGDVHDLLLAEFADEVLDKQKSKQTNLTREPKETISIESAKPKVEERPFIEEEVSLSIEDLKRQAQAAQPKAEPRPEPVVEPEPIDEPIVEAPKTEDPVVEAPEIEIAPEIEPADHAPGVKVMGKIDLSSINSKTRPDKKKYQDPPKKEAPKAAEPVKEAPKAVEPEPETKPTAPIKEEIQLIKATSEKLSGVKLMGKIELPVFKPKEKPVASSSQNESAADKKKRKRIKKVNTPPTNQPTGNTGNTGNNFKKPAHAHDKAPISEEAI